MTALTASETCRQVADIIDLESERFHMGHWEHTSDCGTTACIAGHTAMLHNDGLHANPAFKSLTYEGTETRLKPTLEWVYRQGSRLGLTEDAAKAMFLSISDFWYRYNDPEEDWRYSQVLRQLSKKLEDRDSDDLIDEDELERIAEEALR